MPRRDDIKTICILGSGPIVIGQACEFDYSGTQAIRALRGEGYRVVLINSNPATIMTDPEIADATYIEPLTPAFVTQVLEKERPDALLPTMGGQTALNLALALHADGTLERLGIELLGASPEVIERAEDREVFQRVMHEIGIDQPASGIARSMDDAWRILDLVGFPAILRPSFTMGGTGGNIAYNRDEFAEFVAWGLSQSPTGEVLIDEGLLGWKEFELELVRDGNDNIVVVCGIENFDPMGVHTGDAITVAPIQTLTENEYDAMCVDAHRIIRAVGVEKAGCNIQFAVDPKTGRRVVIEINPRVSRSSALASKATGYPIAKVAALLGVGFMLDEIVSDITANDANGNPVTAAVAPTLDYTVVKIPRFAFEKFPAASNTLTTQMKSVGEIMSIGRTFSEAIGKGVRSLENNSAHFHPTLSVPDATADDSDAILDFYHPHLRRPTPDRLGYIFDALRAGISIDKIYEISAIDPWFLDQLSQIVECEVEIAETAKSGNEISRALLRKAKRLGMGDIDLAFILNISEGDVRELRKKHALKPVFKQVDTCSATIDSVQAYFYSTYEDGDNEATPSEKPSVLILGSGPNRIGQGIEFDYCSVHATLALREAGYRTIMVNCNPETVSTDYDISDRLYFEPLTFETVIAIIEHEKPLGVILQFGGQTPLKLAKILFEHNIPILGTSPEVIDRTEDRQQFKEVIDKLGLRQPDAHTVKTWAEAEKVSEVLGYPMMIRPSYVLGGRAMEVVHNSSDFQAAFERARVESMGSPVLLDKFLSQAIEVDVDCISDGTTAVIGGIMEHIEEAGVHSGDSACTLPPNSLPEAVLRQIREQTLELARELEIVGLMNVQFAVQEHRVFIIEVNPRASRTIPFISKAIGVPLARFAARAMLGEKLSDMGLTHEIVPDFFSVKETVFPFNKFPEVDTLLGPEMRSTGEAMGIDRDFNIAFLKAQIASNNAPPASGKVFISVKDNDKWAVVPIARTLQELGLEIVSTRGTAEYLRQNGVEVLQINKVKEGQPHIVDLIINADIAMVVNTTIGTQAIQDSRSIRRATLNLGVPYFTTIAAARAAVAAMRDVAHGTHVGVRSIQEFHQELQTR